MKKKWNVIFIISFLMLTVILYFNGVKIEKKVDTSAKIESNSIIDSSEYFDLYEEKINQFRDDILSSTGEKNKSFSQLVTDYKVNGYAIWIIQNNKVINKIYVGFEDFAKTRRTNSETRYQVASMSKLMGGIALAQADHLGDLRLFKKLGDLADENKDGDLNDWKKKHFNSNDKDKFYDIGIKRLMSHTAGFDTHGIGTFKIGEAPTAHEILRGIDNGRSFGVDFAYIPGTKVCYSGGGMTAAELALETATGNTFKRYAKSNVLDVAGMETATLNLVNERTENLAWGCSLAPNCFDGAPVQHTKVKIAGGLIATPEDYYRMIYPLYNDGISYNGDVAYNSEVVINVLKAAYHIDSTLSSCSRDSDCEQELPVPFTNLTRRFEQICYLNKCKQLLGMDYFSDDNCSSPSTVDFYGMGTQLRGELLSDGLHRFFHHGGSQPGFRSEFIIDRLNKDGIIVMINGNRNQERVGVDGVERASGSSGLLDEIINSWRRNYAPDY